MHLNTGTRFYLSGQGHFPDEMRAWHGYVNRARVDPNTGKFTGEMIRCLVYTGDLGYKQELALDVPIWVEV
jgi:hypothetical protein